MSTLTTNYGLVKPELTDVADITAMNVNWDTIDEQLKNAGNQDWITPITTSGTDLNNYTSKGIYSFAQAYTPTNCPTGNTNGWLVVIPWNNSETQVTVKQIWFRHGIANTNDFELYVRTMISNSWSSWYNLTNRVDKSGDTLTGSLTFNNTSDYHALQKYRAVNETTYGVNVGCGVLGGQGVVGLEVRQGSSTDSPLLGRLEIGDRGVSYVDSEGVRTYLVNSSVVNATVE